MSEFQEEDQLIFPSRQSLQYFLTHGTLKLTDAISVSILGVRSTDNVTELNYKGTRNSNTEQFKKKLKIHNFVIT